ncbi:MAG: GspH/FimT family pseudopilin [Burkholderiales bacterium]|nr:GspH/FimT family pseudopilin [Burkholderiales bacterium]
MTLVELMIALVIIAALIMVAMPSFSAWLANAQIRNAAEGILNGMQFARAQAIQRNTPVWFELAANNGWTVTTLVDGSEEELQSRPAEGSATAEATTQPAGATTLTFNGMGWVVPNADSTNSITRVDVESTVVVDGIRPLRITVGPGGAMKMCDPAVADPDPRVCP